MGSISPVDATNALDVIAAETAIINQATNAAKGVVNDKINSVTDAAKTRVRGLLGN